MIRRRPPYVAGRFYMGYEVGLEREIKHALEYLEAPLREVAEKEDALGIIVPHAGYDYSGPVAAAVYNRVVLPDSFIIIGPNHTGFGEPFSVMSDGLWQTPFWDVEVDASLAEKILSATSFLKKDYQAHMSEHAIEVQLPFIQHFKASKFKIVPIGLYENSLEQCKKDGEAMAEVLKKNNQKTLIVATSDLTHYEPQEVAEKKDKIAIDAILEMDPEKLFDVCEKNDISMCGPGAVAMMLYAVKAMGATKAQLVKYMTSAERSKDTSAVVGYVGITVS